ncbi:hypothetical protein JTE90_004013 [Oedothorax gibbosus]|uniref:Uncharacterized protein n=1 Tax=Oedothorax gibbosus TaxID=931172 RepID=A0AAV6U6C3_9ARAC|nr:hypothetical protein JTE90_004013 [Oedothorax gibbosus]
MPSDAEDQDGDSTDLAMENTGTGGSSQNGLNILATTASKFMINIKILVTSLNNRVNQEARKLNQKDRSDLLELTGKVLLTCMQAEAEFILSDGKIKDLEELIANKDKKIFDLQSQIANSDVTLETIDGKLQRLIETYQDNQKLINELLNKLPEGDTSDISAKNLKIDEAPVMVIDTNDNATALSYRDALMARAPELNIPNPMDLVIPRANRLIVKMRDTSNLEKFKNIIDNDPNLNKLALAKISKCRKDRLILFGPQHKLQRQHIYTNKLSLFGF